MGRQEWERAVAFETYEKNRNSKLPQLALAKDQAAQMAREKQQEQEIRDFLGAEEYSHCPRLGAALSQSSLSRLSHADLAAFGVADDLTGPARLKDNATSYIKTPSPDRGYFDLSTARDPARHHRA